MNTPVKKKMSAGSKIIYGWLGLSAIIMIVAVATMDGSTPPAPPAAVKVVSEEKPVSAKAAKLQHKYDKLFDDCCSQTKRFTKGRRKGFSETSYSLNTFEAVARQHGFTLLTSSHLTKQENGCTVDVVIKSLSTGTGWQAEPVVTVTE